MLYLVFVILLSFENTFATFTFNGCTDWGSSHKGECTAIAQDGPLGLESGNSVWIQNGYLDYGNFWAGCPYKKNTCLSGFSYYGWLKLRSYPADCNDYGVIVSTDVFNIHIRGNGHLVVFAWLPNGTEYYVESPTPIALNIWYPIIIQFRKTNSGSVESWKLVLYAQSQLIGAAFTGQNRTYNPPNSNLLFGGSGNGRESHNTSVQFDSATLDPLVTDFSTMHQTLLNLYLRQAYCDGKYGVRTSPLRCFWVESFPLSWKDAFSSCSKTADSYGYPYGRLARFPSGNDTVWTEVSKRIAVYGNGTYGITAWIGGGRGMQWLDAVASPVGVKAVAPRAVQFDETGSTNNSCLQINTKSQPWRWSERSCNDAQKYVCEMSFDCLLNNPCKNFGVCQPLNDGSNICTCWEGTSGQFCEEGTPTVTCIRNCSSCSTSSTFKLPTDCSSCLTKLKTLLNQVSQLEMQLKTQLISLNVDMDQAEMWQSRVLDEYDNFTKTLNNNFNVYDLPECDMVWTAYGKKLVHDRIIRKFVQKIQSVSPNSQLPQTVMSIWGTVNQTEQQLKNMEGFNDVLSNVKQTDDYEKFENCTRDNHMADNEWLQKRFSDSASSGKNAMGILYFGDSITNERSEKLIDHNNQNSNEETTGEHNSNSHSQTSNGHSNQTSNGQSDSEDEESNSHSNNQNSNGHSNQNSNGPPSSNNQNPNDHLNSNNHNSNSNQTANGHTNQNSNGQSDSEDEDSNGHSNNQNSNGHSNSNNQNSNQYPEASLQHTTTQSPMNQQGHQGNQNQMTTTTTHASLNQQGNPGNQNWNNNQMTTMHGPLSQQNSSGNFNQNNQQGGNNPNGNQNLNMNQGAITTHNPLDHISANNSQNQDHNLGNNMNNNNNHGNSLNDNNGANQNNAEDHHVTHNPNLHVTENENKEGENEEENENEGGTTHRSSTGVTNVVNHG